MSDGLIASKWEPRRFDLDLQLIATELERSVTLLYINKLLSLFPPLYS